MEDQYELLYDLPHKLCRCRNKYNKLTNIGRIYREYYLKIKENKTSVEALKEMGIMKMCCRSRLLNIPIGHMIDRSSGRYFNHEKRDAVVYGTRELKPGLEPPNFPLLPIT